MGALFAAWPPEAVVATITLLAGALAWPVKAAFQLFVSGTAREERIHEQGWKLWREREGEVVSLRQLLDKARRRESAYATGCELLLIAMPPAPTPEQLLCVKRAKELFETALLHSGGDGGGGE